MDPKEMINRLSCGMKAIERLARCVGDEQARWKPSPDRWSVVEVVNHLYDEERDDFRKRLDLVLHHPEEEWPGIDPEAWAAERGYNDRNLDESLRNFLSERERSLAWLEGLDSPDWDRTYAHPKIGDLEAGTLLASWAAHDFLHIRQLARLHVEYLSRVAKPYSTKYAVP